jgi:hypothetical protein
MLLLFLLETGQMLSVVPVISKGDSTTTLNGKRLPKEHGVHLRTSLAGLQITN